MPGIIGIFAKQFSNKEEADLQKMRRCLLHESSYSTGSYSNERLGLGVGWAWHPNSFSDCTPIWNEAKDVCLIFSGEEFNDNELLGCLQASGHDSNERNGSYLVKLYEEKGIEFLQQLNGWFSGVLVDLRKQEAVLFNDRYGLNRIYYHETNSGFYFATEAKSLLSVLPAVRQIDTRGLAELCSVGCVLQNRTIFSGVSVLPAGSRWTCGPYRTTAKESYFSPSSWEDQSTLPGGEFYDQLRATFARVLPKYFRGDQRVGMSLTGGLDGRMIMAWARRPSGELPCYTFGGSYRDCTDVTVARKVAKSGGQPHQVIPVDGEFHRQFPTLAERSVYFSDGTMDVTGAVELYVNDIAKKIAPIRLTGNYGSEILRSSVAFKPRRLNPTLYEPDHLRLSEMGAATYHEERQCNLHSFIAFKQVPWHHTSRLSVEQTQLTMRSPFLDNELVALMYRAPRELAVSPGPALRLIADGDQRMSRIPTDRGLLFRPFPGVSKLRNQYNEFTFKAEYAYDYGMPQWLAKIDHALRSLRLERLFLGRHKFHHFRVWYRDQLSRSVKDVLLDPLSRSRPFFRQGALENLVTSHLKGTANYTSEIHQAFTCELIQRQLIERDWSSV